MLSPPRLVSLALAIALLGAGGAFGAAQFAALAEYESTTGTVQTARVENLSNDSLEPDLANLTLAGERAYAPNVTYTYTVDGERYRGHSVAYGTSIVMGDRGTVAAAIAGVEPGPTTVYYRPENPADAHLHQRLAFFPAGVLLLCGLLVAADTLTPRARVVALVSAMVPIDTLERLPGVAVTTTTEYADDPEEILTARRLWAGTDPAPFRGAASDAVWFLSLLFITDLVLAYFLLSTPPYDLWAVAACFVVFTGVARLGFRRVLD